MDSSRDGVRSIPASIIALCSRDSTTLRNIRHQGIVTPATALFPIVLGLQARRLGPIRTVEAPILGGSILETDDQAEAVRSGASRCHSLKDRPTAIAPSSGARELSVRRTLGY